MTYNVSYTKALNAKRTRFREFFLFLIGSAFKR